MAETMIRRLTIAAREETLRQRRDNERASFPAGTAYYEDHVSPYLVARAVLTAMREPTDAMWDAVPSDHPFLNQENWWRMIDAALEEG